MNVDVTTTVTGHEGPGGAVFASESRESFVRQHGTERICILQPSGSIEIAVLTRGTSKQRVDAEATVHPHIDAASGQQLVDLDHVLRGHSRRCCSHLRCCSCSNCRNFWRCFHLTY